MKCLVCASTSSRELFSARDPHYGIPGAWSIRECEDCRSWFLESPPSASELAALYPPDYYSYQPNEPSGVRRFLRRLVGYSDETGEPEFANPGRVLDFGCGAGDFLLSMQDRGWECVGVEISDSARAAAKQRGVDVRPALTGADAPTGPFDYVRANHSLEHVPDPQQTLAQLKALLKPGGTLFIGVPTTSGVNSRVFGPHWWLLTPPLHTFVPSTSAMTAMLQQMGFTVQRARTNTNFASTGGSLQIWLNRNSARRSNQGVLFALKPLLLLTHWIARLQDVFGAGDRLEIIATKSA